MAIIKKRLILIIAISLFGCQVLESATEKRVTLPQSKIALELPETWRRSFDGTDDILLFYHGFKFQKIRIREIRNRYYVDEKKQMMKTIRVPQDLELWLKEIQPNNVHWKDKIVIESGPSIKGQYRGWQLLESYKIPNGLTYKELHYAYLTQESILHFSYTAVARHYFDRDLQTFEDILHSLKTHQLKPS